MGKQRHARLARRLHREAEAQVRAAQPSILLPPPPLDRCPACEVGRRRLAHAVEQEPVLAAFLDRFPSTVELTAVGIFCPECRAVGIVLLEEAKMMLAGDPPGFHEWSYPHGIWYRHVLSGDKP